MLIEGMFAAITTPFYSDERVYLRKLEANIERYSRSPLAGLVVLGSTGEANSLDDGETRDVLREAVRAATADKVMIAGIGRESAKATVELAEFAAEHNYDVVLVRTPTYYAPQMSSAAVLNYFRTVADRSPLQVLLYNIPKFAPYQIPVEMVGELAQHPNIIGIKDSEENLARIKALLAATASAPKRTVTVTPVFEAVTGRMLQPSIAEAEAASFVAANELISGTALAMAPPEPRIKTRSKEVGFQVLAGASGVVLDALEAGASGAILAFAACAPQACCEIYSAWKDRDPKLAAEKQKRILAPGKRVAADLGISGIKHACDFNGYYGGKARLPLLPISAEQKHEIEELLAEIRN